MMACRPCVTNHVLAFILLATIHPGPLAAETLPPLIGGKAPTNLDELWAGFDRRKEPLEDEMLHEWEQDGAVCRVVRYRVGVFKGAPATIAAFYAFPNLTGLLGRELAGRTASTTVELADLILDEVNVAFVPGEAFGAPGYGRFSYALGDADLEEGLARIQKLVEG
jgi:hypothetical protein